MKTYQLKHLFLIALTAIGFSCRETTPDEPSPLVKPQEPKLLRVAASAGSVREFTYNAAGQFTTILGTDIYSLDGGMSSSSQVVYNSQGKIAELLIQGENVPSKIVYHYAGGQLMRSEVWVNQSLESSHTYEYNTQGQIVTQYSAFQTLNSNEPVLKYKYTFEYDTNSNLQLRSQFEKASGSATWNLYQTSKFEDYDNNFSVKRLTTNFLTPGIKLHQNNPGKITLTNYPGGTQNPAIHTYQYNTNRYPVKEITTAANGNSFETIYTYAD